MSLDLHTNTFIPVVWVEFEYWYHCIFDWCYRI